MKKRLTLKRESLAELAPADLVAVRGANESEELPATCPVLPCLSLPRCGDTTTNTCDC